ncbi:MAG TPA: glycoside hydrolase family 16 protein [Lachnospiraceae bacterium]|nr:glycoside hydrolase family 16 protein [Lachnospiraceae bacterium]HEX3078771.1 glycoside hydrolase family 16 protein [Lachnospiraceae bacterium]
MIDKGKYKLEFWDDFKCSELDTDKWLPYYLPQWSSCRKASARYRIEDSILTLYIDKDQMPWSPEYNGDIRVSSLQTGVFSGGLGSKEGQHHFSQELVVREVQKPQKLYTPKYGYIEFKGRCRIAPYHVAAFWMIGFEDQPHCSAEICIFELKGSNIDSDVAKIGYGVHPFGDSSITDEFYEEQIEIDVKDWNVYGAEWLPDRIHFYINGELIRTIHQSPQYEMQFMLNIYDLENRNEVDATFDIDYVAGYSLI